MPRLNQFQPLEKRLWKHIQTIPFTGCWIWCDYLRKDGYANFSITENGIKFTKLAHIVSYEYYKGPVPQGLQLDHICRTRSCLNPDHLEPVTQAINILRGVSPSAFKAKQTHCKNGHILVQNGNQRGCKVCVRNYQREYSRQYRLNNLEKVRLIEKKSKQRSRDLANLAQNQQKSYNN